MSSTGPASSSPGPSNLKTLNFNKRTLSDVEDIESRDETKVNPTTLEDEIVKDRRKRKKKKRKKLPVVGERRARIYDSDQLPLLPAQPLDHTSRSPGTSGTLLLGKPGSSPTQEDTYPAHSIALSSAKVEASNLDSQLDAGRFSEAPDETIARLRMQLDHKNSLLSKHENALLQVQQTITCQICLDLMFKPYALAPCGHLACYECLVRWFKAAPAEGPTPPALPRKKTCPHCRSVVSERPVEVWGIKSMVAGLAKTELLKGMPPVVKLVPGGNDDEAPADPWLGIFHKRCEVGRYYHPFSGFPIYHPLDSAHPPPQGADMGMYDAEDGGIYRCLDCMHEIWEGVCSSCGRVYAGHDDHVDHESDDEFEFGVEDALNFEMGLQTGDFGAFIMDHAYRSSMFYPQVEGVEDSSSDSSLSSDGDSMGSFIVDDEASSRVASPAPSRRRRPLRRSVTPDASSDVEPSENGDQDARVRQGRRGSVQRVRRLRYPAVAAPHRIGRDRQASSSSGPPVRKRRRVTVISSDVEGSESEKQEQHSSHDTRCSSDDEEDDEGNEMDPETAHYLAARERDAFGEDDSIAGPPSRLRHLFQESEEQADEDEGSVEDSWYGHEESSE